MVLDPIFIYTLDMGIDGAAWATFTGFSVGSLILFYWLFIEKKTYVTIKLRGFSFNRDILSDIFKVGFPASLQQLSLSILILIINGIIVLVDDISGVAVFRVGMSIATIAMVPLFGVATAVVEVSGAAYGSKDYKKLDTAFIHSTKLGLTIESIVAIITFIFA